MGKLSNLLSWVALLFMLAIIPALISSGWGLIVGINWHNPDLYWFMGAFVVGLVIFWLWSNVNSFVAVFGHEFTHLVAGLICFVKPKGMVIKADGSGQYETRTSNAFIRLAPYFLPTFNLLFMLLYLVIKPNLYPYYFVAFGLLAAWHIVSVFSQTSTRQTDITKSGCLTSIIVIVFGNLFFVQVLLAFVNGGFAGIKQLMVNIFTIICYHAAWLANQL